MKPKHALKHPFGFAHYVATKRVVKQWAQKFDLVYFGKVDQQEDDYELVRGITLSAEHKDDHYTVGNFRNHDLTLVERQNILTYPGKPPQAYRWLLLQIDLQRDGLPHIFIDANHHEEVFYANLFVKFSEFDNMTPVFQQADAFFAKHFKVFAPPERFDDTRRILNPDVMAMLAHHFKQFDYELQGDRLVIYASNSVVTLALLQEMMRVGFWLADHLNSN